MCGGFLLGDAIRKADPYWLMGSDLSIMGACDRECVNFADPRLSIGTFMTQASAVPLQRCTGGGNRDDIPSLTRWVPARGSSRYSHSIVAGGLPEMS